MSAPYCRFDASPLIDFAERTGRKPTGQGRWSRAWHRMVKDRTVTVTAADEFCVHVLGEHPAAVLGPDWSAA